MNNLVSFGAGVVLGAVVMGGAWWTGANETESHYDAANTTCRTNMHDMYVGEGMQCYGMIDVEMTARGLDPLADSPDQQITLNDLKNTPCQKNLTELSNDALLRCEQLARVERNRNFFAA